MTLKDLQTGQRFRFLDESTVYAILEHNGTRVLVVAEGTGLEYPPVNTVRASESISLVE